MANNYSDDIRMEAVRRVVLDCQRASDVARDMQIREATVYLWVRRHRRLVSRNADLPELRQAVRQLELRLQRLKSMIETSCVIEEMY